MYTWTHAVNEHTNWIGSQVVCMPSRIVLFSIHLMFHHFFLFVSINLGLGEKISKFGSTSLTQCNQQWPVLLRILKSIHSFPGTLYGKLGCDVGHFVAYVWPLPGNQILLHLMMRTDV